MKTFKEFIKEGREYHGVDLDGTLAHYTHWRGATVIGKPIPKMVERIKKWIENGEKVKIFTARADDPKAVKAIKAWLVKIGLPELDVTNVKDQYMVDIWDDRAKQVVKNTGELVGNEKIEESLNRIKKEGMGQKPKPEYKQRRCHNCGLNWWETNITNQNFCPKCRKNKSLEEKLSTLAAGLLAGSMLLPHIMQAKDRPQTSVTQPAASTSINNIVNLILKHEGLVAGQTPFRITSPNMQRWDKILGFKVDKSAIKPADRQNFIFLQNAADVPKAVKKQFQNYANNPTKYGLAPNVSLKDAIIKFDQSGAKNKIQFLLKNLPDLNINRPLKEFLG